MMRTSPSCLHHQMMMNDPLHYWTNYFHSQRCQLLGLEPSQLSIEPELIGLIAGCVRRATSVCRALIFKKRELTNSAAIPRERSMIFVLVHRSSVGIISETQPHWGVGLPSRHGPCESC